MAISGGDGSIILTTSVDTSGISKGSISIRSALQGVDTTVKKVQNSFSAFREQKVTLQTLNQAIKDQQYVLNSLNLEYAEYVAKGKASSTQAKELKANIDAATAEMKEMQAAAQTLGAKGSTSINKIGTAMKTLLSYFIGIQTIFKVINFSGEAAQFATQTEASVQRLIDIYGEAAQSVSDFIDANARAIGMSRSAGASIASTYGNLLSVWADQATNAELTNSLLNQTAVVASKTGRTTTDVAERIRSGLLGNTEAIEDLGINVNIKTIEITDAFKRIADGRSWEQLNAYEQSQVRTLAILEQSTKKYGTTVAETSATVRNQYQAAYEDFQNTWGQVVNKVLIPVLEVLTQVFTIATKGLQVMAGLSGKTVENSGQTSNNIKQQTKEQEKLNKALKKGLASFDEINILSQETAESSGDAGGANVPITSGGGETYNNSFVDQIDADLATIMGYVGFALAAIGIILICFGHIGWGIGFLIAGAAIFSVSQAALSEGAELEKVKNIMNGIIAGVSLLALVLGIILVCTTKNPKALALGIGLIVVGAAGLATEIALNWNAIKENVQKFFTENGALIAGISFGLLVIGVLLCFAHQWGLGIGLIAAGAVGLAAVVAVNWNAIKNAVTKFIDENTGLIVGVAAALLVLGIVLCLCGVITPLSIGLIVAGAGILAAEVTLNWEETKNKITKFFKDNAGLIVGISLAILVLGILLCCCGTITPLSIGMIVFGAAGLVAEIALNWNYITEKVKKLFKDNAGLIIGVSLALLVIGIILCFTGVGIPLAIGLISAGAAGLATTVALNWNAIKEKVSNAFNAVVNWVKTYGLLVIGILLCLTGVGIPLGIALIVKWAKDGVKNGVPLANVIVDKVKQVWNAVTRFWDTHIAPIFTAKWWADLGKKCINGLISGFEGGLNGIISGFEWLINKIVGGLNKISIALPDWDILGDLAGKKFGFNINKVSFDRVKIPRLAKGAVIPPNREFLAVLGDQKQGMNIEAPLQTIVDAFNIALAQNSNYNGGGNTEVILEIDGREFGRAVVEQGNRENRRIGTRLVIA